MKTKSIEEFIDFEVRTYTHGIDINKISNTVALEEYSRKFLKDSLTALLAHLEKEVSARFYMAAVLHPEKLSNGGDTWEISKRDWNNILALLHIPSREEEACSSCKKVKPDVSTRACGYSEEVNGTTVMETICDACEHEHLMDI